MSCPAPAAARAPDAAASNPLLDAAALLTHTPTTPALTAAHLAFRQHVRAFVRKQLTPAAVDSAEACGRASSDLLRASYAAGLFALRAPVSLGGTPPAGTSDGQFDLLFDVILVSELSRCGAHGLVTELMGSFGMLLPLMQAFGGSQVQPLIKQMIRAEKFVCLAVTEPPPSRQAKAPPMRPGLRTTATLSADGTSYEVNGEKMYISFALRADYILTAVQLLPSPSTAAASVGEDGASSARATPPALSLLLIPRSTPGVRVDAMSMCGWRSTSTTRITFSSVRVPVSALLVDGSGDKGSSVPRQLALLMRANVTRERFVTAVIAAASARVCLDDAIAFARSKVLPGPPGAKKRQTVLQTDSARAELVAMASRIAQAEALVWQVAAQMSASEPATGGTTTAQQASTALGEESDAAASARRFRAQQCALLKHACSDALSFCLGRASALLGAAALEVGGTGPGARIERLRRDAPVNAAAGGGEHTLALFVAKQAKL